MNQNSLKNAPCHFLFSLICSYLLFRGSAAAYIGSAAAYTGSAAAYIGSAAAYMEECDNKANLIEIQL